MAQVFQRIVFHVDAVHQHLPFRGVVEPRDEVDQGGFALAGAANDGNHLAGLGSEGDVGQDVIAGAGGVIFKGDIPKFHLTCLFRQSGCGTVLNVRVGVDDFKDTLGAGLGTGIHQQAHSHHHNAHEHHEDVVQQRGQQANLQVAAQNGLAAQVEDEDGGDGDAQHHSRLHEDDAQAHVHAGFGEVVVGGFELLLLKFLSDIGFDHTDGGQIFLDGFIEQIQPMLHGTEQPHTDLHQQANDQGNDRHGNDEDHSQLPADIDGYCHRGYDHHAAADEQAQSHGYHVLHVGHIIGQTGDQRGSGELVDVAEGKGADLLKLRLTQVGAQTLGGKGGVLGGHDAAVHGGSSHHQHQRTHFQDDGHIALLDAAVNDLCHQQRQDQLADGLQRNERRRQDRLLFVSLEIRVVSS